LQKVQQSLQQLIQNDSFRARYDAMKQEVLSHPKVQLFLAEHKEEVNTDMLDRSLVKLYEYIGQSVNCEGCVSVTSCENMIQGYHPHLIIQGKMIDVQYDRCPTKVRMDERKKHDSLIQSIYVPKDILQASLADLALDDSGRFQAIRFASEFVASYEPGKKMKGLYLHGSFGVGKTYILGAIANELAEHNVSSMLVYLPEFLRELKGSMQDNSLNSKLEAVKNVPVLMLDDIGAESMSSWVRDDILGTILQFRMLENLPTFFTSNFNFDQLLHHLTYTQRGEEEKLKAARVMERIKYLADPVELQGKNRRD
jgi:primosomal protein DnaI